MPLIDQSIPFIRVMPDKEDGTPMPLVLQRIRRSDETNMLAARFISSGGRYLVAMLDHDLVRLAAMVGGSGTTGHVLLEMQCRNGPELEQAVDAIVRDSVTALDDAQ